MFFSSDPAVSSSIFVGAEREELITFWFCFHALVNWPKENISMEKSQSDFWRWFSHEGAQCATCAILGRHFEWASVAAHVHDKYKTKWRIASSLSLVAAQEGSSLDFASISGCEGRRHHTGILFLSCELPRSRSRQNSREPKRQTSVSSSLLEYDLKSR